MACRSRRISATTIPASISTRAHIATCTGLDSRNFTVFARHLTHGYDNYIVPVVVVVAVAVMLVATVKVIMQM